MNKAKKSFQNTMHVMQKGILVFKMDGFMVFLKKFFQYILYGRKHFHTNQFSSKEEYDEWITQNEDHNFMKIQEEISDLIYHPRISIIMPVYNVDSQWLNQCIQSVLDQFYQNWELCIYDDASTNRNTILCLKEWENKDVRIKIIYGEINQHISGASNEALKMTDGEFIALLDDDDELAPNALFECVKVLNSNRDIDFIYSDEDKLDENGFRVDPYFKPDWSLNLFLKKMYTCHLGLYRKSIIDKIYGFRKGFEGAQDYDLVLRFIEHTAAQKIYHIPKVLYHWRKLPTSTASHINAKRYTVAASYKAVQEYMKKNKA